MRRSIPREVYCSIDSHEAEMSCWVNREVDVNRQWQRERGVKEEKENATIGDLSGSCERNNGTM